MDFIGLETTQIITKNIIMMTLDYNIIKTIYEVYFQTISPSNDR